MAALLPRCKMTVLLPRCKMTSLVPRCMMTALLPRCMMAALLPICMMAALLPHQSVETSSTLSVLASHDCEMIELCPFEVRLHRPPLLRFAVNCTALHCSLHCTALHCTSLHCTALHCQSCKNLGSVVALLQGNFEKSHDFKANFEEKRAVLMRLQKLDDNFLPLNSITKLR